MMPIGPLKTHDKFGQILSSQLGAQAGFLIDTITT